MRILLVQRTLDPPGGGNAVAAWMLQALVGDHEVGTLTEHAWTPAAVDRFYGTRLTGASIPQWHSRGAATCLRQTGARLDRLRMSSLLRKARRVGREFDLLITADNYAAFDRPGIQYLHYPLPLRPVPDRYGPLVHAYYVVCDAVSGLSFEAARKNRTLVNSRWTAERVADLHPEVLYPPVADPGKGLPWPNRVNTFLCVGRFHGSKRLETVVSILDRVRAAQRDVSLTFVGSNVDAEYTERIRRLAGARPWITILEDLSQAELFLSMRRCRYGIHAMENEHFGIAPAEMARAGCVVFAHESGGLVEVLNGRAELLWQNAEAAVVQILAVMGDDALQRELSTALVAHARRFAADRFVRDFRRIVATTAPPSS